MKELRFTINNKQEQLLNVRAKRTLYKLCSEAALQSRVAAAICESELREIIKKYDLCDVCDFTGLHISVAKVLVKCVVAVTYKYPRLRSRMNFIGSRKGYMSLLDKLAGGDAETIKSLGMQYIADRGSINAVSNAAKELLCKSSTNQGNTLAQAIWVMGILDGIIIDEEDFNNKEFRQIKIALERAVEMKQSPQGCASVEAVIYHETGHLLDFLCSVSKKAEVVSDFNSRSEEELKDELSLYAATSVCEYVAEGFAESMSSPAPRQLAKRILSYIDSSYAAL